MQSLNDDMDDLFREAGKHYPLKTEGADWDKVMQGLQAQPPSVPGKKKKDYRFLWLLLLLPIGFMVGKYSVSTPKNNMGVTTKSNIKVQKAAPKIKVSSQTHTNVITHKIKLQQRENKKLNRLPLNSTSSTTTNKKTDNPERYETISTVKNNFKSSKKQTKTTVANPKADKKTSVNQHNFTINKATLGTSGKKETTNANTAFNTLQQNKKETAINHFLEVEKTRHLLNTLHKNSFTQTVTINDVGNEKILFQRHAYITLLAGPDVSFIKKQHINNIGYTVGLLLGYQVSPKLSIEAGAFWDKKDYYTAGRFVDSAKLKMPLHSKLNQVTGYCTMVEIPVNIKYNVLNKKKQALYVVAGASSYLMQNEEYNYNYTRYNRVYNNEYYYNETVKEWFAVINGGVGYQQTINKKTLLRVEPYIKLPVKKIGHLDLPVSSTGLLIGISRTIQ